MSEEKPTLNGNTLRIPRGYGTSLLLDKRKLVGYLDDPERSAEHGHLTILLESGGSLNVEFAGNAFSNVGWSEVYPDVYEHNLKLYKEIAALLDEVLS